MMYRYLVLILLMYPMASMADEDTAVPEVPEMPMPVEDGEPMEADITITREGEKTLYEYRVNGKLYKIKVVPTVGPAYYFLDVDGDGEMEEVSESDLVKGLKVNQWTLFSW